MNKTNIDLKEINYFQLAKEELDSYRLKISEVRCLVDKIAKLEREIISTGGSVIPMPDGSTTNNISTKIAYLTDLKDSLKLKLHEAENHLIIIDSRISKMKVEDAHFLSMKYIMLIPPHVIAHNVGYSHGHVRRKIVEAIHNYAKLYFS